MRLFFEVHSEALRLFRKSVPPIMILSSIEKLLQWPAMSKQNILIADDDPVLREAYRRKFKWSGYEIRLAGSGEETVRMIGEKAPDLLICDIAMPHKDGWWVVDQFPKKKRAFPVVMLTNLENEETRKRCALQADGYFIKKDMDLVTLVQMAASILAADQTT